MTTNGQGCIALIRTDQLTFACNTCIRTLLLRPLMLSRLLLFTHSTSKFTYTAGCEVCKGHQHTMAMSSYQQHWPNPHQLLKPFQSLKSCKAACCVEVCKFKRAPDKGAATKAQHAQGCSKPLHTLISHEKLCASCNPPSTCQRWKW